MTRIELDAYVLDTLMPDLVGHDRAPSALLVFLYLWRHTIGSGNPSAQSSLLDIATGTGLSRRAVQTAIDTLSRRRLLSIRREGITSIPIYTLRRPWIK